MRLPDCGCLLSHATSHPLFACDCARLLPREQYAYGEQARTSLTVRSAQTRPLHSEIYIHLRHSRRWTAGSATLMEVLAQLAWSIFRTALYLYGNLPELDVAASLLELNADAMP